MEKVNLQSEGIGHREKALQRERDFGLVTQLKPQTLIAENSTETYVLHSPARMFQRTSRLVYLRCMRRTLLLRNNSRLLRISL